MNNIEIWLIWKLLSFILNNLQLNITAKKKENLERKVKVNFDLQIVLREQLEQNGRSVVTSGLLTQETQLPIIVVINIEFTIK